MHVNNVGQLHYFVVPQRVNIAGLEVVMEMSLFANFWKSCLREDPEAFREQPCHHHVVSEREERKYKYEDLLANEVGVRGLLAAEAVGSPFQKSLEHLRMFGLI